MRRRLLVILALITAAATNVAVAQFSTASTSKTAKVKKQRVEPSYAWRVSEPLGLHYPSTIDTLHLDYHRTMVPSMVSEAWATTGNYGAPGQDQIFFNRPAATGEFFFEDAIAAWMHNTATMRFYNTRIPMTLLSHSTGGDKYSNLDRTQLEFSGNVNRKTQLGGGIDYIYSKGSYDAQADKDFTWRLFGSHMGDRYEVQAFFDHYNYTTKESGGITDDRYITDPAEVQGGVTRVDNKSIPTLLTNSQSHMEGSQLYLNQRYKVGYYRYRRDSVTDTVIDRTYVPVTSFIWTLDFKHSKHQFLNKNGQEDTTFFDHTYLSLGGTDEATRYWGLRNTLGVSMLEGFNKYAKFGFAVYGTHEVRRYTQVSTDSIDNSSGKLEGLPFSPDHSKTQNLLWLGGQLTKQQGSLLRYNATAQFGVLGDVAGEVDITGDVTTRFKLLGDSISVKGYGYFKNLSVPYLIQHFVSNHYAWDNNFSKTKRVRVGGELDIPFSWTRVNVGYETLTDFIYWDANGRPAQHGGAIHVLSARLQQGLHFKAFNWDNSVVLQTSSNEEVLPLPKFAIYSNMYATFTIARVLHVQMGVDGNFYTEYYAPTYNPATMTFHGQQEMKCGGFPILNLYANFKMKQARFFVAWTHFNQKISSGDAYFATPHYPLNPARLQVGVSVNFVN